MIFAHKRHSVVLTTCVAHLSLHDHTLVLMQMFMKHVDAPHCGFIKETHIYYVSFEALSL